MDAARIKALTQTVIAGLPGRMVEAYSLSEFQVALDAYKQLDATQLRANLAYFLKAVVPVAEEAGVLQRLDGPAGLLDGGGLEPKRRAVLRREARERVREFQFMSKLLLERQACHQLPQHQCSR